MIRFVVSAVLLAASGAAAAQVQVKDAWARPALQGQTATGAFMSLMSSDGARLVGASSSVAGVVEIHEMVMEGSVMKMRAIPGLDLPPGRSVELKPGSFHVMFMGLKQPLEKGQRIKGTLEFEKAGKIDIEYVVEAIGATPAAKGHQH